MFDILTLNKIAKCGLEKFGDNYKITDNCENPDVIVLSSAIFKDREGITAGVKKCRKAIDEAVMKYQL